jgi:uncharacterized protein
VFCWSPIIEIFVLKLHADLPNSLNTVTAYGTDYLEINQQRYRHSVIFMPEGEIIFWPVDHFAQLNENHFSMMAQLQPELVIFGSGPQHRFPRPAWLKPLMQLGIGVETMDTQAACRTYNILMAEGRKVLAALLLNTLNS